MDTGWYAGFGRLVAGAPERVDYSDDGFRFWGATFDPTALYRFNAVMDWLDGMAWAWRRSTRTSRRCRSAS